MAAVTDFALVLLEAPREEACNVDPGLELRIDPREGNAALDVEPGMVRREAVDLLDAENFHPATAHADPAESDLVLGAFTGTEGRAIHHRSRIAVLLRHGG